MYVITYMTDGDDFDHSLMTNDEEAAFVVASLLESFEGFVCLNAFTKTALGKI